MNKDFILASLDQIIPNPKCELNYTKDYELLISTMLSAQSTDKRVNEVAKTLYRYNLEELSKLEIKDIENIIMPVGTYHKKAEFVKTIATRLLKDCNGKVPNDRDYLESLPGIGRKTTNVVLSNIYGIPSIAVDTHVTRIAKRLKLVNKNDDVLEIEKKLCKKIPKDKWNRVNDQIILFGRYYCKAKNPLCDECPFKGKCNKDFDK
jgi:endonuclease-3